MSSIVGRLGLWRLWRNRFGRTLYRLGQRLGLVVALMVRYESPPASAGSAPTAPAAFTFDSWRAADPSLPAGPPDDIQDSDVVVGATIDGDLAGYCVLSERRLLVREIGGVVEPTGVYLWDLYVEPAYRGRGLGTALLERARADAAVVEAGTVEALVAMDNEPSRRAFAAAGFEPTQRLFSVGVGERTYRRTTPLGSAPES